MGRLPNEKLLLIAIIAFAAALRFFDLSAESLWNDELYSWNASNQDKLSETWAYVKGDVNPPGYQTLLGADPDNYLR